VVLYAPTFRKHPESAFTAVMEAFADDRFTFVAKPHDLHPVSPAGGNVVDATGVDVLDLLPLADVVVTDYSAVAFEACAIGKPLFFYVHDIDEYAERNGLNLDPRVEMPATTSPDITAIAEQIALTTTAMRRRAFCARFGPPPTVT
jgi:CDP-glycerol glycerophosphotransferase (TagB/SpsB family)